MTLTQFYSKFNLLQNKFNWFLRNFKFNDENEWQIRGYLKSELPSNPAKPLFCPLTALHYVLTGNIVPSQDAAIVGIDMGLGVKVVKEICNGCDYETAKLFPVIKSKLSIF